MELITLIKEFADIGGIFLLALIALYWNRVDAKEQREDKLILIKTLQDVTKVLSELETLVKRINGKG